MAKKLGKILINNLGLKILAVVCAIILWIVVVNINDPSVTINYTTSITLENENYISSINKFYEVLDGKNTITFPVYAQRTVQEELSNSDFSATADATKLEFDESAGIYRVPVVITANRRSNQVTLPTRQYYLELSLEDLSKKQFLITTGTTGTVADGCALGDVTLTNSNVVNISGPSSVVKTIEKVEAAINVDGMSTDVTNDVVLVLYDKEGNEVDTSKLTMSVTVVSMNAQILNTKDVALECQTSGSVAPGYIVTNISYSPVSVRIKGEAAVLNGISKIVIPADVLAIGGASSDIKTSIDISTYLPSGVSLVLASDAKINVTISIDEIKTQSFDVPFANVAVENLPEGFAAKLPEGTVAVEITGAESDLSLLNNNSIRLKIDGSGLSEGAHMLGATVDLDSEVYTAESVPVTFDVIAAAAVPETEEKKPSEQETEEVPESETETESN